jgi:hypothetical protein
MPDADKKDLKMPSGHVRHEPGGRAVWQWAVDSGRATLESTSRLLKKLDLTSLQFLDFDETKRNEKISAERAENRDRPIPAFGGKPEVDPLKGSRQGFDPYNARAPVRRTTVAAKPKPGAILKSRIATQPVVPPRKTGLFSKLFGSDKR